MTLWMTAIWIGTAALLVLVWAGATLLVDAIHQWRIFQAREEVNAEKRALTRRQHLENVTQIGRRSWR